MALLQHSPGETDKTKKNLNQDRQSLGPRIEPGTSQVRSRSVNHLTTMFSDPLLKYNCAYLYYIKHSLMSVWLIHKGLKVLSNDASRQNVIFYKCCYHLTSS
jgi:hypothetical protein